VAGFLIDQALGPRLRPDPCSAVPGAGNLALGKPVTASGELPEAPATRAVDGLMANWWGSGGYPYQWIDIDLGSTASIARARLFVSQYPDGPTTHRILTRATTGDPWDLRTSGTSAWRRRRASPGSPGKKSSSSRLNNLFTGPGPVNLYRAWSR
jgi:hypothetical protein